MILYLMIKVMVNISRMVAPILIYISIPIAFPEHADSALLDFLRRLCMIYILCSLSSLRQCFVYGCVSGI